MGDQPTELDCAAFGILSQIRWNCPDACPGKTLINGTLFVIFLFFCYSSHKNGGSVGTIVLPFVVVPFRAS